MELAKISSKGQLVIPASIRKNLRIHAGMVFEVQQRADEIVLKLRKKSALERLYGALEGEAVLDDLEKEHRDELAAENRS